MARKLPHFLQHDEPEQLLRQTTRQRDRILLMMALYMGLRVSELHKLRVEQVDFRKRYLFIREGKGQVDRGLPIPRVLVGPLRGFVGKRREGPIFVSRKGNPLSVRQIQALVKQLGKAAGIVGADQPRRCTPHKLRHAFATRMLERGADINAVKEAMGHRSISTTATYLHTDPERLRECMEV